MASYFLSLPSHNFFCSPFYSSFPHFKIYIKMFFLSFLFYLFSSLLAFESLTLDLWGRLPSAAMEAASGDQPHHSCRAGSVRKPSTRSSRRANQANECVSWAELRIPLHQKIQSDKIRLHGEDTEISSCHCTPLYPFHLMWRLEQKQDVMNPSGWCSNLHLRQSDCTWFESS